MFYKRRKSWYTLREYFADLSKYKAQSIFDNIQKLHFPSTSKCGIVFKVVNNIWEMVAVQQVRQEVCTTKESPSPTPQYPEDDFFYELLAEIRTR